MTKEILTSSEFKDFVLPDQFKRRLAGGESIESISKDKGLQDTAFEYMKTTEQGRKIMESALPEQVEKPGTFKGPEGFGAVIGVGANPVLEKMTRQNEIMEEIKIILQEQFLINRGGMVPSPFTERQPLTLQKIGAV
jgi:hypothetical protein